MEGIQLENNLTIIDLALLHGRYNIAQYIYARLNNKELKTPDEYQHIAQKYYLRYVNYEMMIEGIKNGKLVTQIGDISARPILSIDTEEEEEEQSCCCCQTALVVSETLIIKITMMALLGDIISMLLSKPYGVFSRCCILSQLHNGNESDMLGFEVTWSSLRCYHKIFFSYDVRPELKVPSASAVKLPKQP